MLAHARAADQPAARDAEALRRAAPSPETGFWARWARIVTRRPRARSSLAGIVDRRARPHPGVPDQPERRRARRTSRRRATRDAGATAIAAAGHPGRASTCRTSSSSRTARRRGVLQHRRGRGRHADGTSSAPPRRRRGGTGDDRPRRGVRRRRRQLARGEEDDLAPPARRPSGCSSCRVGDGATLTLGGVGAEASATSSSAVYGKFPYVLLFVLVLTFVLLMRAFRSIVLPLKAVILNLVSLGAAYGIVVFIFQEGHGSDAIWGVQATDAVISWIPLMIFAFLYGISMDYEVFMLTRIREEYDETARHAARDRARARAHGQARHERGSRAHVRVLLALDRARGRTSSSSRSASPPGRVRRDRDPRAARPVDDAAARPLELDLPAARRAALARRAQRDVTPFADGIWLKREDEHELGAFKWRGARRCSTRSAPTSSSPRRPAITVPRRRGPRSGQASARSSSCPREASAAKVALDRGAGRRALPRRRRHGRGEGGGARATPTSTACSSSRTAPSRRSSTATRRSATSCSTSCRSRGAVVVPVGNGALAIGVFRAVARRAPRRAPGRGRRGRGARRCGRAGAPARRSTPTAPSTFADGLAVRVAIPLAVAELNPLVQRFELVDGARSSSARVRRVRRGGDPRRGRGRGAARGRAPREPAAADRADRHRPEHRRRALQPAS